MTAHLDEYDLDAAELHRADRQRAELRLAELRLAELRLAELARRPERSGEDVAPTGVHTQFRWAWRGAHSGAGTTTLASHLGGHDAGMKPAPKMATLVVCRATVDGLVAAQRLAAGELVSIPTWHCLGLVVVEDSPAPPSRAVTELAGLVSAGYPASWPIPWMETWRTDAPPGTAPRRRFHLPFHLPRRPSLHLPLDPTDQSIKEHP